MLLLVLHVLLKQMKCLLAVLDGKVPYEAGMR